MGGLRGSWGGAWRGWGGGGIERPGLVGLLRGEGGARRQGCRRCRRGRLLHGGGLRCAQVGKMLRGASGSWCSD
jgi:hypothetical protein